MVLPFSRLIKTNFLFNIFITSSKISLFILPIIFLSIKGNNLNKIISLLTASLKASLYFPSLN